MSDRNYEADLLLCLKKYWGYSQFLEGQLEICMNILKHKDSFVLMATGSGKSLTFQLPAVYLRERGYRATTVVVSPLISLIDDQVSALLSMGIPACAIGSDSTVDIEARALHGEFTVVYATPEKLLTWQHGLRELRHSAHIACFAVDESHCVSEWGHEFRPDYRRLGELREVLGPDVPWVGLTASATVAVQADIVRNLRLNRPLVAKAPLNRPNLKYCVINRTGPNDLLRLINEYRKEQLLHYPSNVDKASVPFYSTLVYVNSKKETEELAKLLVHCKLLTGIKAAYYHAGMNPTDRSAVHHAFSKDEIQVVIATVAFGMGINKPDVRMVIHYGMTKSVESYYQQTGRAGRDGLPAKCVLLFSRQDVVRCFNISTSSIAPQVPQNGYLTAPTGGDDWQTGVTQRAGLPPPQLHSSALNVQENETQNATQRLSHQIHCMKEFSTTCGVLQCRRKFLLHYFGESLACLEATDVIVGSDITHGIICATRDCCDLCDEHLKNAQMKQAQGPPGTSVGNPSQTADAVGNGNGVNYDVSKEVSMLLRTIIDCNEAYGINVPLAVLLGKHDKSVQRVPNYSNLAHFGGGTLHSAEWWKALVHQVTDTDGFVEAVLTKMYNNAFSYQRYVVTARGREYLAGPGTLTGATAQKNTSIYGPTIGAPKQEGSASSGPTTGAYTTPLSKELRSAIEVEHNMKRPPMPHTMTHNKPLQRAHSAAASCGPSSAPGSQKSMFSFVPESMAFDPTKVAQFAQVAQTNADGQKIASDLRAALEIKLRQTRNEIAQASGLNPYNILVSSDMQILVFAAPASLEDLATLPGWGDWKLRNFGAAFVDAIKAFKLEHRRDYDLLERITAEQVRGIGQGGDGSGGAAGLSHQAALPSSPVAAYQVPVPARPVVRLYRPNYDANAVPDPSNEVPSSSSSSAAPVLNAAAPAASSASSAVSCAVVSTATGDSSVASCSATSAVSGPARSPDKDPTGGTGTDVDDDSPGKQSLDGGDGGEGAEDHTACSSTSGLTRSSHTVPRATSSAYAAAAKKRLASTGLGAFKARKEVKLARAHTDPTISSS